MSYGISGWRIGLRSRVSKHMKHVIAALMAWLISGLVIPAQAQNTSEVDSSQVQVLADTAKSYALPDLVSSKNMRWTKGGNKWFTWQLGFVPIIDYTIFIQDEDSKAQVGKQDNQGDIRSGRISIRGNINFKKPWRYFFSVGYNGLDYDPNAQDPWNITDLSIAIPVGPVGTLSIGKLKEPFVYEMVGDAANLPQSERILNPFFASRNIGLRFNKTLSGDRMTLSAGWFNDWFIKGQSFNESANTFAARFTGLPIYEENGKRYMHLGIAARYLEAENDVMRFKGKNESNVSSNYLDTKDFTANHAWMVGFEQLWSVNNFSLLGEYVHAWSHAPNGNEQFGGYYLTGSWVISGEQRPYDKVAAYARRIKPYGRAGAWELVARVSRVKLNTPSIEGGNLLKLFAAVNWWATQYWRLGIGYGAGDLDKDDRLGVTNSFLFRLQWIY